MDPQKTTDGHRNDSQEPQLLSMSLVEMLRKGIRPQLTPEQRAACQAQEEAKKRAEEEDARKQKIYWERKRLSTDMGARYANCSLANYSVKFLEQKNAIETVKEFLSGMVEHVKAGRGLILYGSVGTGKDHLLAACMFAAIDAGFSATWKNAQSIYEAARDKMDEGGREAEMLKPFLWPTILGLSDPTPPAGDLTGFRVELLWRIADVRYREMKPIWLTMNANSIEECQAKLSVPLWDRLQDNAVCVPCFWPSNRKPVKK